MQPRTPRLMEIVGPAGAGKSTLASALAGISDCVRLRDFPDVRQPGNAPFFILHGLRVLPGLLSASRQGTDRLTRRQFAWLSILDGWPGILHRDLRADRGAIMLDQGPAYLLTELFEFGPDFLRGARAELMLRNLIGQWASLLDMVVWLDAPDAVLAERIYRRDKEHVAKNESMQAVFQFLDRFRLAYEHTLSRLIANRTDLSILRFDTSKESPLQIANQVLAVIK
jgi:shikimate kinase